MTSNTSPTSNATTPDVGADGNPPAPDNTDQLVAELRTPSEQKSTKGFVVPRVGLVCDLDDAVKNAVPSSNLHHHLMRAADRIHRKQVLELAMQVLCERAADRIEADAKEKADLANKLQGAEHEINRRGERIAELEKQLKNCHDEAQSRASRIFALQGDNDRLRKAIQDIKKHIEFSSPTGYKLSATWNIANKALGDSDD